MNARTCIPRERLHVRTPMPICLLHAVLPNNIANFLTRVYLSLVAKDKEMLGS